MYSLRLISALAMSTLPLLACAEEDWNIKWWFHQPNCGGGMDEGGDTERGGAPGWQQDCNMLAMPELQSMLITNLEDGCTVSLYPTAALGCDGEPLWSKSKEALIEDEDWDEEGNYTCQTNIDASGEIGYWSYTCE
jgi:hypothetical protein